MNVRKKRYKILGVIFMACVAVAVGVFWYIDKRQISSAEEEEWNPLDLSKMVEVDNKSTQTLTTARATFYDIYSDSQVYGSSGYRTSVGSITDGANDANTDNNNTFTRFNNYLATSTSNGIEYKDIYIPGQIVGSGGVGDIAGVYPLYCGLMYPGVDTIGQSAAQRWGSWSGHGKTYGNWFAHANANQFHNGDNVMADQGVATTIYGGATQGLVNDKLDSNGNITIGKGEGERVVPVFDSTFLNSKYEEGKVTLGSSVSNIAFPFHKGKSGQKVYLNNTTGEAEDEGYYYFDSYTDTIHLNESEKNVTYYYNENFVYDTTTVKGVDNRKRGFFPYNNAGDTKASLNYVFGVKMELNFNMTSNGKINGKDIVFEFNGDDDLWVFVDGYLVLDIGGAHIPVHGTINFAQKTAVVDKVKPYWSWYTTEGDHDYQDDNIKATDTGYFTKETYNFGKNNATDDNGEKLAELLSDTTRNHTLTIFYMERGKGNSNLKIKFNLPQISTLSVGNEVDASDVNKSLQTDALWKACNSHKFKYKLENYGTKDSDYNNSITAAQTPSERQKFTPIGLDSYRKKMTSEDGATQRLRFFTFTGKNYFSMVVSGTDVTLPNLNDKGILNENGCAKIDGNEYVFLGWTTDETYRDHWEEILNDMYTGECPKLEPTTDITVKDSVDYYAVWAKKDLKVTYYDEISVDTPLGYSVTKSQNDEEVAYIGYEQFDTKELKEKYTKGQSVLPYWDDDAVGREEKDGIRITRYNWKTDETRKGFSLTGWKLKKTEAEGENSQISASYSPLCDVNLYADWTRTCYRALFTVENAEQIKTSGGNSANTAERQIWQSNIVYFPMGVNYEGYLPYMTDESNLDSFQEIRNDVTCYAFTSLPIRENYAIVKWTQNDEDNSSFRTTDIVENGKTLYRQKWTLGEGDVIFAGTWKQITSTITFQSGTYKDGKPDNWESVKKKYAIGAAINRPERESIFTEHKEEDTNGWEIVGWKKGDMNVSFPYKITEESVIWTAVWKRINSKVTYHFDDTSLGITGKKEYTKHCKIGSNIEKLTLEGMGNAAPFDPDGSQGTKENHTTYYVKANGKAYVIDGWKDKNGNLITDQKVTEEDCDVYAVWKEVHTTLDITVNVLASDSDEWDTSKAVASGWNQKVYDGGTTWTKRVNLIPGEKFSAYFDKSAGSLKDVLYSADVTNDINHVKDIQYDTVVYPGGNYQLTGSDADENAKVPYTSTNHACSVTGNWVQKQIVVTFAEVAPNADIASARVLGYQIYNVSNEEIGLPTQDGPFLDENGTENSCKVSEVSGYKFSGWKISSSDKKMETLIPTTGNHNRILYTRWEKIIENNTSGGKDDAQNTNGSQTTNTEAQSSVANTSVFSKVGTKVKGMLRLFSNTYSSDDMYNGAVDLELYELHDLQTEDEGASSTTGSNGEFYLTYDQVASFLNCFTLKSKMVLQEDLKIYHGDGTENASAQYNNMYSTTWELRDIHGYITSRRDGDHSKDLKNMSMTSDGKIYDGRVEGEDAFLFQNENDATGASYATNVRALFTHKIKTSDITITKELTDTAYSVATRKGEQDQEYTFKVIFFHIFGDTTSDTELLYEGEYTKLNQYGNYVRDEQNKIKTFTATDGKISVKNGETAIISGIPVMTEYTIEEVDKQGKKDMYLLSKAKEITATGLASEDKKYAVSDEINTESQQYLQSYDADTTYAKSLVDNSSTLKGKKLSDLTPDVDRQIIRSFTGKINTAGYTYNYVATNEVLIDGVSLYIEKMIDEFYYTDDDRFTEDRTYQQLTDAKQTFIFTIKYTPVEKDGTPIPDKAKIFQHIVTFDPEDDTIEKATLPQIMQTVETKKGYKKTAVVLGLESGYYEISEDENWSWKYDLMGVYAKTQKNAFEQTIYEAIKDGNASHEKAEEDKMQGSDSKVYRCYIRGQQETLADSVTEKTYDNKVYQVLDNAEEPSVCFLNLKATDGREDILGDTDVVTNIIAPPTPTPNPNKYKEIFIDDAYKNQTLLTGETCILPEVQAVKADGTGTTSISNDNSNLTWDILSGSEYVSLTGTTMTAKAVGTDQVQATYMDIDGITKHTATMNVTVVEAKEFALKEGSTGQSGDYLVKCVTDCSHQNGEDKSYKAIDGNESSMWVNDVGQVPWGQAYWGVLFKDDAGIGYCKRKISKVTISFEKKDCQRTIALYGVSGDDLTGSASTLTLLEEKTLGKNQTTLEFNITPGSYNGIKVVMKDSTDKTVWPAIAEVKIWGL